MILDLGALTWKDCVQFGSVLLTNTLGCKYHFSVLIYFEVQINLTSQISFSGYEVGFKIDPFCSLLHHLFLAARRVTASEWKSPNNVDNKWLLNFRMFHLWRNSEVSESIHMPAIIKHVYRKYPSFPQTDKYY